MNFDDSDSKLLDNDIFDPGKEYSTSTKVNLSHSDNLKLKVFYSSKLTTPLICENLVHIFTSLETHLVDCSLLKLQNKNLWKFKTKGAILLQIKYDDLLLTNISEIRLIVVDLKTCIEQWSTKLNLWNRYRKIDDKFHVFSKWNKYSNIENEIIPEDFSIGIYFPTKTGAKTFFEFVDESLKKLDEFEKQKSILRKMYKKNMKKNLRNSDPIKKTNISYPTMFIHTIHSSKEFE